jgi:hypothetical protein
MQQTIVKTVKPMSTQEALDWAARGCYHACEDCEAYKTDERRSAECSGCLVESTRFVVINAQQKMMKNGGGQCA